MSEVRGSDRPELSSGQWLRLEELLGKAIELQPEARRAFLDRECVSDPGLRAELESLLAAHEADGLLDRAVLPTAGRIGDSFGSVLAPRTIVSHYQVEQRLGSGGMGVVYRARDLRLGRTVALKFLPPLLSGDPEAKKRFLTEARAAATLAHVNVCTVHEIDETGTGQLFIAMAFVEGESLRELIARGPLPIDRVLDIARQIALGLDCAHRSGIVHRDVKPANVMVGVDGVVRLVDFGIAKLPDSTVTATGGTPGTVAYMSPEQASGDRVDRRTDLWAFGIVLFEMLTGRRPFLGDNEAVVLNRIITATPPDVRSLRPDASPALATIVERCLQKNADDRFESARELHDALTGSPAAMPNVGRRASNVGGLLRWRGLPWIAVTAFALVAAVATWLSRRSAPTPLPEMLRVSISAPGAVTPQLSAAISPNGRQVAFVATGTGGPMLWVRDLDQLEPRSIPGTEHAAHAFWSPDGQSIGFIADNRIKRVDLPNGPVRTLADSALRYGPAWGPDGTILFSRRFDQLMAVSASGGPVRTILTADTARRQTSFSWPRFLPDGRHFIYHGRSERPELSGIYVGSLDSKQTKFLLHTDLRAWYAPPGYLVYPRDETLLAQPFDPVSLELHGEPTVIADGVWLARPAAQSSFSVSETGALAYVNATLWDAELSWFDRTGKPLGAVSPPVRYEGFTPRLSPDGNRIVVARGEYGKEHVVMVGAVDGTTKSLTAVPQDIEGALAWSADGHRVMYKSGGRLFVKDVARGTEQVALDGVPGYLEDWSKDGRYAVLQYVESRADLIGVRLVGDGKPFAVTKSPFNETQAHISPDGKWVAYTSNETGRDEVYVQSFPVAGRKRQVSRDGGAMPRWRSDGKELFFLATNQFMTAVPVTDPSSLTFGAPAKLFRTRLVVEGSESTGLATKYDVSPHGDRFLLRYPPEDPGPPITVVINWQRALKR